MQNNFIWLQYSQQFSQKRVGRASQIIYRLWKLSGEPPETVQYLGSMCIFLRNFIAFMRSPNRLRVIKNVTICWLELIPPLCFCM